MCSIRLYGEIGRGGLGIPEGEPVIVCPKRFEEDQLLILAGSPEIVGFAPSEAMVAREVPFICAAPRLARLRE